MTLAITQKTMKPVKTRKPMKVQVLAILSVLLSGQALADPSACLMCHEGEEFEGMDVAAVQEALADPGIPAHGSFAELTEEAVAALLEELGE